MPEELSASARALRARSQAALDTRAHQGRLRELTVARPARLNLADNDYLGLSHHGALKEAVRAALTTGPASASSSPLVRGYTAIHAELEAALCAWHGCASAMIWTSGYSANQALVGTLAKPGDWIFADRLVHHSLIAGIQKSGSRFSRFAHNDLDDLEERLAKNQPAGGIRWVVTESIFSMDGDGPDLARLVELKRRHDFIWVLDEAHALGWYGPAGTGRAAAAGASSAVDIFIGTFGKAFGAMGAYTLFHDPTLRAMLVNHAAEFIYSTYLTPLMAAAAIAAVGRIQACSAQASRWRAQSRRFRAELCARGWTVPDGDSPIVPVLVGTDEKALALGQFLGDQSIAVGVIRPPTVPKGAARLRISMKAQTTWDDLCLLMEAMDAWQKQASLPAGVNSPRNPRQ